MSVHISLFAILHSDKNVYSIAAARHVLPGHSAVRQHRRPAVDPGRRVHSRVVHDVRRERHWPRRLRPGLQVSRRSSVACDAVMRIRHRAMPRPNRPATPPASPVALVYRVKSPVHLEVVASDVDGFDEAAAFSASRRGAHCERARASSALMLSAVAWRPPKAALEQLDGLSASKAEHSGAKR